MTTPRIEVDLGKIRHNTQSLVGRLKRRGISVTGVTKAVCGHPAIARAMIDGGVTGLADSRISNVQRLRDLGIKCPIFLIRTPMLSQVERVVRSCDTSYNTEIEVIRALAAVAVRAGTVHNIVLMVEMGDQREGIRPKNVAAIARQVVKIKGVDLKGIGANFACLGNAAPDAANLVALSELADEIERQCGFSLEVISGGNSASVLLALRTRSIGRINNLRLGEAILLGVDPVSGVRIRGLYTDAFSLVVEVIETKIEPEPLSVIPVFPALASLPRATQNASIPRSLLAIGHQDTDIAGLSMPAGIEHLGATSDHLLVQTTRSRLCVGDELRFSMNYSALMRAMAAPDVTTKMLKSTPLPKAEHHTSTDPDLALV